VSDSNTIKNVEHDNIIKMEMMMSS